MNIDRQMRSQIVLMAIISASLCGLCAAGTPAKPDCEKSPQFCAEYSILKEAGPVKGAACKINIKIY